MRWTDPTIVADDPAPARRDDGLRVDPVRIARQRSTGGLAIAAAIAAALVLAVVKPWSSPSAADARPAPPLSGVQRAVASVAAPAVGSPDPTGAPVRTADPLEVARLQSVTRVSRVADWDRLAADLDHLARQPIVSDRDLGGTSGDGTCGGSARITPFDELIGIVAPAGQRVADVRLFAIDSIHRPDISGRIRSDRPGPLDGRSSDPVTVVELPVGGLAPHEYALIADLRGSTGPLRLTYTICVG